MRRNRCGGIMILVVLAVLAAPVRAQERGDRDRDRDDRDRDHDRARSTCDWTQWGQSPSHDGQVCVEGQHDLRVTARITIDPFAAQEAAEANGTLTAHYGVPLLDEEGNVFMMRKGGTYVSCDPPGSGEPAPCGPESANQQVWVQQALRWRHGHLVPRWSFTSDWKPIPTFFEPMFQAAMTERFIYVPGAGGTVFQLEKDSGRTVRRINPFGTTIDPLTFVSGGLTVDRHGTLLYNVVHHENSPTGPDAHSWLVKVPPHGAIQMVDYRTLIPGAPAPTDLCYATFGFAFPPPPRPWPPAPQPDGSPTLPRQVPCFSQRAATNVTPAIGRDGTIFTVSRAHSPLANNYAYLVALRPDLSLKWAASLRDRLDDGCGVTIPFGTRPADCRIGATPGVDPTTNLAPAGQANDSGTSSPTALPDGGVLYGAYTGYNGQRGHLMKFDRQGALAGTYDFGWDVTPAIYEHDHTYSILIKDNHYATLGPFLITRLDPHLQVEWQFANTETQTCARQPDGTITCEDTGEFPNGFEWCINAPTVDREGTVYGLSEDGNMYAIDRNGQLRERVFLALTRSAAYTPLSIDTRGRIYAQNNGELYILEH